MQFSRYLTYRKSSSSFRWMWWVLKAFLIAASFYYVVIKILAEQFVLREIWMLLNTQLFALLFVLLILLMVFNWVLEAKKWQVLAQNTESLSFSTALKAILSGVSLDAVIPFGAGAASSKLLSLEKSNKQKLIAPVILAQGIQSFWTILFGLIGVTQLAQYTDVLSIYDFSSALLFIIAICALALIVWWQFWVKSRRYVLQSLWSIPKRVWGMITVLSFTRYLVFFVQLMLLSVYLAPEIPMLVLSGCITWMFFAKTIVPKPGHLGALGIRGASVVFFLNLAGYNANEVVLATLILWFVNLAIPSLVGLYFIKDLSFKNLITND